MCSGRSLGKTVQVKLANFETTQTVSKSGTQIKGTYNFDYAGKFAKIDYLLDYYSAGQKKRYQYCFIKQKCQIQIGITQYKIAAIPLKTRGMDTSHQHFQMRYKTC